MKIAILTLPLHTNYGGILQAYALQTVLERMGHEAWVITIPQASIKHLKLSMPFVYLKRCFNKYVLREDISIWYDRYARPRQYTDRFIRKRINQLLIDDFGHFPDGYDAIVVGSDQIWRPRYAANYSSIGIPYLEFLQNDRCIRRIAYAASFGVDSWEYSDDDTSRCSELASRFDAISVREESGVRLCKDFLHVEARRVLDPTLLLTAGDYKKLIGKRPKKKTGYVMTYILDQNENTDAIVLGLSRKTGLPVVKSNSRVEDPAAASGDKIQPPVENWISLIINADYVVTDSFHACVFSILFQKPFYVFRNSTRGNSRIDSLMRILSLQDRVISQCPESLKLIEYDEVESTLCKLREESMSFLSSSLKD